MAFSLEEEEVDKAVAAGGGALRNVVNAEAGRSVVVPAKNNDKIARKLVRIDIKPRFTDLPATERFLDALDRDQTCSFC